MGLPAMKTFRDVARRIGPWLVTAGLIAWLAATTQFDGLRSAVALADFGTFSILAVAFAAAHLLLTRPGLHALRNGRASLIPACWQSGHRHTAGLSTRTRSCRSRRPRPGPVCQVAIV